MLPLTPLIRPPEPPVPIRLFDPPTLPLMLPPVAGPATIVLFIEVVASVSLTRALPLLDELPLRVELVSKVPGELPVVTTPPFVAGGEGGVDWGRQSAAL